MILNFCDTDPAKSPSTPKLITSCPPSGTDCGPAINAVNVFRGSPLCTSGNTGMTFENLPPGIYYYPVFSREEALTNGRGPYVINITANAPCCADCRPDGDEFVAEGVEMLAHIDIAGLGTTWADDIWGYVSPSGREYAIVGSEVDRAVIFVEITDPFNPVIVGQVAHRGWDMKTFGEFAYAVTDFPDGVGVIDLTEIDDAGQPSV